LPPRRQQAVLAHQPQHAPLGGAHARQPHHWTAGVPPRSWAAPGCRGFPGREGIEWSGA
jgi:hypothetical protein